ncbi:MAG: CAP domain-containing protein [Rhizobiaceae bacterium]
MLDETFQPARRIVLLGAGSAILMPLAACVSVLPTLTTDGVGMSSEAERKVALARRANGQSPLSADRALEAAAIEQAGYMSAGGKMEHTALRGRDFVSRMKANGIAAPAAENLAHGRFDVARVIDVWMASPPHRRNMLDGRFGKFGLGYVGEPDNRRYWAMVLAA